MHIFTPEDLLQYLYKETSNKKTAAIKAALENDWELNEIFKSMVSAQNQLEEIELSPREETVKKILEHAENTVSQLHPH